MGRKFTVVLERDPDGIIVAKVPAISGCYTQGKDVAQALERIKEAIALCLETDDDILSNEFIGVQYIEA